jgi:hypothetical protein
MAFPSLDQWTARVPQERTAAADDCPYGLVTVMVVVPATAPRVKRLFL